MRGGPATMVPLTVGILAGVLLLVVLAQIADPLASPTKVRRVAELIVGAVVFMVVTRHQLRGIYLAPCALDEQVTVSTQWGRAGAVPGGVRALRGLTVYALARAVKDRPGPGEAAA